MKVTAPTNTKAWLFWSKATLLFFVFSFVGRWLEILVSLLYQCAGAEGFGYDHSYLEPYVVYGAAAVASLLVLRPLYARTNKNPMFLFVVAVVMCGIVEYIAATIVVYRFGRNVYWDYSEMPLNLNGHICLQNTLAFGVLASAFIAFGYPQCEKLFSRLNVRQINWLLIHSAGAFSICTFADADLVSVYLVVWLGLLFAVSRYQRKVTKPVAPIITPSLPEWGGASAGSIRRAAA